MPALAPWIAIGSLAAVAGLYGLVRVVLKRPSAGGEILLWSYAALVLFHAGYLEIVPSNWAPWFSPALLLALLLSQRLWQSIGWMGLTCLGWSLSQRDHLLGQSSLLVFGATAAKVMLYDLSGAAPLARIVSLVILGVTFYVGGMLYQRMLRAGEPQGHFD